MDAEPPPSPSEAAAARAEALAFVAAVRSSLAAGRRPPPAADPALQDAEAARELGREMRASALEQEYRCLQARSWFYVAAEGARGLHPPSSAAASAARTSARRKLVELLGPELGVTPATVGRAHLPRPLRMRREAAAFSRENVGPQTYDVHTARVVALRPAQRCRATNLRFSAVPRFGGNGCAPLSSSPPPPPPLLLPPPLVPRPQVATGGGTGGEDKRGTSGGSGGGNGGGGGGDSGGGEGAVAAAAGNCRDTAGGSGDGKSDGGSVAERRTAVPANGKEPEDEGISLASSSISGSGDDDEEDGLSVASAPACGGRERASSAATLAVGLADGGYDDGDIGLAWWGAGENGGTDDDKDEGLELAPPDSDESSGGGGTGAGAGAGSGVDGDVDDWADVVIVVAAAADLDIGDDEAEEGPAVARREEAGPGGGGTGTGRPRRRASAPPGRRLAPTDDAHRLHAFARSRFLGDSASRTAAQLRAQASLVSAADGSVFRRFVSPAHAFTPEPAARAALSDSEWFRVCLLRAKHRWQAMRKHVERRGAGAASAAAVSDNLAAALRAVEKRVHGGRAFGIPTLQGDGGGGGGCGGGGGGGAVQEALQRARSRRRIRALLSELQAARSMQLPPPPLQPAAATGAGTLRGRRLRSGGSHPAPWAPAVATENFAASARAAGAAARGAGDGATGFYATQLHRTPVAASEARSAVDAARMPGRDRIVVVRDELFGAQRVIVPFAAPPADVAAVEAAKGLLRPGPTDYRSEDPELLVTVGPHRRAPRVSIGATTGRDAGARSGQLGAATAAALGGRGDELGLEAGAGLPAEGDVLELDAGRAYTRPDAPRAPRFSFPRAAVTGGDGGDSGSALDSIAGAWRDPELSSVRALDAARVEALSQQVRRAMRFVRAQEAAQRAAREVTAEARASVANRWQPDPGRIARAFGDAPPPRRPAEAEAEAGAAFNREMLRSAAAQLDALLAMPQLELRPALLAPQGAAAAAAAAASAKTVAALSSGSVPSKYLTSEPMPALAPAPKTGAAPAPAPPLLPPARAKAAFKAAAGVYGGASGM